MEKKIEIIEKVIKETDTKELFEIVKGLGIVTNEDAFEKMLILYFLTKEVA
jgi:hypothetical protein